MAEALKRVLDFHMLGAKATMYFITIKHAKNASSFSIDGRCPTIIHRCNLD